MARPPDAPPARRAAQDAEIKLNRETETLNKMERELGQTENALREMGDETDDAAKARAKAVDLLRQAVSIQEDVIRATLADAGARNEGQKP